MLEARLEVVSRHSERVASLAVMLARELGMNENDQKMIYVAGLLHDLGKMAVPGRILFKPDKLTGEEWEEIKKHPVYSFEVLSYIPQLKDISLLMLYHHERYDGRGYPRGLKGEDIPLGARILAVADSYDAMTSHRVYRPAMSTRKALEEIYRCAGTQFDPRVVEVFFNLDVSGSKLEVPFRKRDREVLTTT
ncbi:MAG: HD-GYP domain-containing protein [Thermoanaerobacter sp.]|nr:HD-GYP domain-containing protein [Thermoanaerobacter sp.]